jgi:hypothetical protein
MSKVKNVEQRNTIRIAILGKVSCGKSTLLNGIFVKQYADMKMKRTTMLPFVYQETNDKIINNKDTKQLYEQNVELNKNIYNNEIELTNDNCNEVINFVPCIENFIELPDNIFLDLYDIPGLDDAKTANIYFKWVKDNFYKFDIVIHVVDIMSALNTEGEMKILDLITDCIKYEKDNNDRKIPLFTLINKCDDMIFNPDNNEFELESELDEMYKQIIKTTEDNLKSKNMKIHCKYSPFSAIDTFIYRMLANNPNVELDMKLLNKFGQNELGRSKWNRSTDKFKKDFIKKHFSECDVNETLEITGYQNFKTQINNYLNKYNQYTIIINRLKYELKQETILSKNITKNINDLKELIKLYNNYSIRINIIDKTFNLKNKENNKSLILNIIVRHIENWILNISDISNESEESIQRLEEYKKLFSVLNNDIIKDCLNSKIELSDETINKNTEKWLKTTGMENKSKINSITTLRSLFNNIKLGYSKLQNNYYLNKLNVLDTYNNFPENIFNNLNKLQDNNYDNIEITIQNINEFIIYNLKSISFSSIYDNNNIYRGYISNNRNNNIIIKYCESLIEKFDYPKYKLIEFLHIYMLNRYNIILNSRQDEIFNLKHKTDEYYIFHAYPYLLDAWLSELSSTKSISKDWKNLYIINKSYCNHYLNPFLYYNKQDILALPLYLKELENINENESDDNDFEDVKCVNRYSILEQDNSEYE